MTVLTREELDTATCNNPNCDHRHHDGGLFLASVCHPGVPFRVKYADGLLTVICAGCSTVVVTIAVAGGMYPPSTKGPH